MRITIDVSVAHDPDGHRWLDRILGRIEDGWHVWDLPESDAAAFRATTWIKERAAKGDRVRDALLVKSTRRDAWTPNPRGRRVHVTPHPSGKDELTPEQAFRLADEPLVILVENRYSDGAFVERVVKEMDKSLRAIWGRGGEPIRFDSVGGAGQMPREVETRAGAVPYRPRLVAVVDSDRRGPGDPESANARRLREVCDKHGLSCWVLAKREAENYLPRTLLRAMPNAGDRHERLVEAWDRLGDDQKDFFDMKDGLPDAPSVIEEDLFDDLLEADREILATGFGPNVHECWNRWDVRDVGGELLARGRGDIECGLVLIRKEL